MGSAARWTGLVLGTAVLPLALLASFVLWAIERDRTAYEEELSRGYRALAAERARAFEARLGREVAGRIEALAAATTLAERRAASDEDGLFRQAFVLAADGDLVYPPERTAGEDEEPWPVDDERASAEGLRLERAGDLAAAAAAYRQAAEGPAAPVAWFRLALLRARSGERDEALAAFDRVATSPGAPYLRVAARLEAAALSGDPDRAAAALEAVLVEPLPRESGRAYLRRRAEDLLASHEPTPRVEAARRLARRVDAERDLVRSFPNLGPATRFVLGPDRALAFLPSSGGVVAIGRLPGERGVAGGEIPLASLAALFAADLPPGDGVRYALRTGSSSATEAPFFLGGREFAVWAEPAVRSGSLSRWAGPIALLVAAVGLAAFGAMLVARGARRERAAGRAKSEFIARVSHELKTPLTLVRGLAETLHLGRAAGAEKEREYVATILREAEALSRLVDGILDFSRLEARRGELERTEADLAAIVRDAAASVATAAGPAGIEVRVAAPDEARTTLDPEGVRLAVLDLLTNAVKFAGAGREIDVSVRREGGSFEVEVADRGPGLDPSEREAIFEPFRRGSAARPGIRGSGLGLALVRGVARRHGGDASARARPGGGAVFTLRIPT